MSTTNDTPDLESLFDSIAADYAPVAPAVSAPIVPPPSKVSAVSGVGDNDDLQALFDSVAADSAPKASEKAETIVAELTADATGDEWPKQEVVFNRIGHMARSLHDTLGDLGYDKLIQNTVSALPDAKDRLAYVANLTEQAACRVLNATDVAVPLLEGIESGAQVLGARWDKVFANQLSPAEFKQLAIDTRGFLQTDLQKSAKATHAQLTEIMMAQDFQDLTGQVIKKIVTLSQELEANLMGLLLEVVPETRRTEEVNSLMNGPVINAAGRGDVVVNQEQVDDLLDSLGF
jgi:chemotaxis protein CheZ